MSRFDNITKDTKSLADFIYRVMTDFEPIDMVIRGMSKKELEKWLKEDEKDSFVKWQTDFEGFMLWWRNRELRKPRPTVQSFLKSVRQHWLMARHNYRSHENHIYYFIKKMQKNSENEEYDKINERIGIYEISFPDVITNEYVTKEYFDIYEQIRKIEEIKSSLENIKKKNKDLVESIQLRQESCENMIEILYNKITILDIMKGLYYER